MKTVTFQAKDKAAKETTKKLRQIQDDAEPAQVSVLDGEALDRPEKGIPIRDPQTVDVQFPTTFQSHDPRDKAMAAKLAMANEKGVTPFGQLIASEADFDWVERKRLEEEEANFQAWFAANYDKQAPHVKKMAHQLFPDFYKQRMKMLEKNVRMQQRVAELKLNGVQSKEDLYLQYAIESGIIPSDPLEHILHPEKIEMNKEAETRQGQFVRGLLNPRAYDRRAANASGVRYSARALLSETRKEDVNAWKLGLTKGGTEYGFSANEYPKYEENPLLYGRTTAPVDAMDTRE